MDYHFENLGDERFQEFCHSLINLEYPSSQAYPVGQPDGGRDSVVYEEMREGGFKVFQVKYVKNPHKVVDPHKWLIEVMKRELPKIEKLIPEGASSYTLMTNVNGTGHKNFGTIDLLNELLKKEISIPSYCWWRDDLCRKVDSHPIFKWSFVDILSGQELLNSVVFSELQEKKGYRQGVLKSYLTDQYEIDSQVKFRQIDLQNNLFDLYTDVPIRAKPLSLDKRKNGGWFQRIRHHSFNLGFSENIHRKNSSINAARLLLNQYKGNQFINLLIEGGPGQGKSTVAQYVCQVHRCRLLNLESDLEKIPAVFAQSELRIPFKIDLRHVASWIEGENPYKGVVGEDYFKLIWSKSLEAFLVSHIFNHSKLSDFSSKDLFAILSNSKVLMVFDGFDEIGKVSVRNEVVEFIDQGLQRIRQNCLSLQCIITSRPAAFTDSLEFDQEKYPHFELAEITPEFTSKYVQKWAKSSQLSKRETDDLTILVNEKLKLSHLRELAKSPMQLAIFISLLRTKGESLPNKRTALYDNYISLFFDRESEKNRTILENRELIIDIHQYLGWVLHSDSETTRSGGIISVDDLKKEINRFLKIEEHTSDIAEIFQVVEERVCALVSRVQGTYEFEVQPLREYFCAKHLFRTSPYCPPGHSVKGTKPERFDAITNNSFWLNVVRFFSGCFDVGELPLLVQKLKDLESGEMTGLIKYPYNLASHLLTDYVFAQSPRNQKEIVDLIMRGVKSHRLATGLRYDHEVIALPSECGGKELSEFVFKELFEFPRLDVETELYWILIMNNYNLKETWWAYWTKCKADKKDRWLKVADRINIVEKLTAAEFDNLIELGKEGFESRVSVLSRSVKLQILDANVVAKSVVLNNILSGRTLFRFGDSMSYSLNTLSAFVDQFLYPYSFFDKDTADKAPWLSIQSTFNNRSGVDKGAITIDGFERSDYLDKKVGHFMDKLKLAFQSPNKQWSSDLNLWSQLFDVGVAVFGEDALVFKHIAIIGAKVRYDGDLQAFHDIYDGSQDVLKRSRYGRTKSGNVSYWKKALDNDSVNPFVIALCLSWTTPRTLKELIPKLCGLLQMDTIDVNEISTSVYYASMVSGFTVKQSKEMIEVLKEEKPIDSLTRIIGHRIKDNLWIEYCKVAVAQDDWFSTYLVEKRLEDCLHRYLRAFSEESLKDIKELYTKCQNFVSSRTVPGGKLGRIMPQSHSLEVLRNPELYPQYLVYLSEKSVSRKVLKVVEPVRHIAERGKWFESVDEATEL